MARYATAVQTLLHSHGRNSSAPQMRHEKKSESPCQASPWSAIDDVGHEEKTQT
jgi:hypothetical protein